MAQQETKQKKMTDPVAEFGTRADQADQFILTWQKEIMGELFWESTKDLATMQLLHMQMKIVQIYCAKQNRRHRMQRIPISPDAVRIQAQCEQRMEQAERRYWKKKTFHHCTRKEIEAILITMDEWCGTDRPATVEE